jgi:hypothetical protein
MAYLSININHFIFFSKIFFKDEDDFGLHPQIVFSMEAVMTDQESLASHRRNRHFQGTVF